MKIFFIFILFGLIQIASTQPALEFRAVKLTNVDSDVLFSDQSIAQAMDYLATIGINTVIPVVWNGHGADGVYTIYPSAHMDSVFGRAMIPTFDIHRDPLERVIIEAHRNGMEVLPWFEMGFSTSYSQNGGHIISRFPHWALKNSSGNLVVKNGFDWMSGINPAVQNLLLTLVLEIIDNYDVDGIEFSDRIPAMPVEGGYDSVTVSIYKAEHGGMNPPTNYTDIQWMKWRADHLNKFSKMVRDSIKARSPHILYSSSPSVYPWCFAEYLQDSKTWVDSAIVDNIIPQLYRYDISSYIYELNQSLSYIPANKRDIFFAGVLLNVGNYVITPAFLLQTLEANRQRNVMGEAFFIYEGLRKNGNLLGDTLKATYYSYPALLPHRQGNLWRPKGIIINEDEPHAIAVGNWRISSIPGYRPNILLCDDTSYAAVTYSLNVPAEGWYDVFPYIVGGPLAATRACFTLYSQSDSTKVYFDQTDFYHQGWQRLGAVYLASGLQKVIKVDNSHILSGEVITADAAMIMINRKLSPDVIITDIENQSHPAFLIFNTFELMQNFPNPFNNSTIIPYTLPYRSEVQIEIFNILGEKIKTIWEGYQEAGTHYLTWDASQLSSGLYLYRMTSSNRCVTRKMLLLK